MAQETKSLGQTDILDRFFTKKERYCIIKNIKSKE